MRRGVTGFDIGRQLDQFERFIERVGPMCRRCGKVVDETRISFDAEADGVSLLFRCHQNPGKPRTRAGCRCRLAR